ncbi:MAG: DUF3298 domain-containing protein [Clostridia bacterium]|nr:DUF3298 domain-containing protein [Clostridia bacterium]
MDKLKRIIGILLTLCFFVAFPSCGEESPQEGAPNETTQTAENETNKDITVLSLNKEYISHYEWYKDYPEMLVRSEYTDVTLDKSTEKDYPHLAKALIETSVMRKRTMEEEKDNFIVDAKEDFLNNGEAFSTYVSTLDVQVRRADSVAVSILEDYNATESFRSFNSLNYDTESGKVLALSDVVTDITKLPATVEKEVTSRMWQGEFNGETAIPDYFESTPEEDITWILDYNGITFYFNPGNIAPTNFGIQTATVTFAEYPDLFNEKYTAVPDAYIVSLPLSSSFFTDITGDNKAEELIVSGSYDYDDRFYYTLGIFSENSNYEVDWFAYDLNPYYVKTADGDSFLYVFSEESEAEDRQMILCVFSLKNGEIKQVSKTDMGLLYRGNNTFAVPTDPENLLLSYDGKTDSVFSANENGIPMKTVSVSSVEEFLNAVSPNTNIVIKKGYYNMSSFISEVWETQSENWNDSHDYVKLRECFDGAEVIITDVSNLYITGETDNFADTELVVTPRYAAVLNFENCRDFGLSGITMGHTETGDCSGNVLNFSECQNIKLKSMDLYGCGVYGIGANKGTGNIYVSNSTIRDCSNGPMNVADAYGTFEFTNCTLTDSDGFGYFEKTDNCTLRFTDCTFGYWETSCFMFLEDITTENCIWSEDYIYPEYGY